MCRLVRTGELQKRVVAGRSNVENKTLIPNFMYCAQFAGRTFWRWVNILNISFNPFNASCSKLLLFEWSSVILV